MSMLTYPLKYRPDIIEATLYNVKSLQILLIFRCFPHLHLNSAKMRPHLGRLVLFSHRELLV